MTKSNNHYLFAFTCLLVSYLSPGQQNEIRVKFIGNCGLYMTDGSLNVYIDFPYKSGAFNYMTYEKAELDSIRDNAVFIFTHRHPDHYSHKLLKRHTGKICGPWKVRKKRRFHSNDLADKEFSIASFRNKHRFNFKHSSYLITWHNKRIFISGDTETAETIKEVSNMDWAFIPPWIYSDAARRKIKIDSKMKVIYHLYPNQKIDGEPPKDLILLRRQNEVIKINY